MSWKALNGIHMIGSATPREIAIHNTRAYNLLYALIDLSNVELSLQRAVVISHSAREPAVTGETKVERDNDHL